MLRIIDRKTGEEYNVILEKVSEGENGGLYETPANTLNEFVNNYVDTKTQELITTERRQVKEQL